MKDNDDVTQYIQPKSDQLNADDLIGGDLIARIESVIITGGEQPISVKLEGFSRVWKPCKTTSRIMAAIWGVKSGAWIGNHVRLFSDPTVKWAGVAVGGIRINGMSGIDAPKSIPLSTSKGKRVIYVIEPIVKENAAPKMKEYPQDRFEEYLPKWKEAGETIIKLSQSLRKNGFILSQTQMEIIQQELK